MTDINDSDRGISERPDDGPLANAPKGENDEAEVRWLIRLSLDLAEMLFFAYREFIGEPDKDPGRISALDELIIGCFIS